MVSTYGQAAINAGNYDLALSCIIYLCDQS